MTIKFYIYIYIYILKLISTKSMLRDLLKNLLLLNLMRVIKTNKMLSLSKKLYPQYCCNLVKLLGAIIA